MKNKTKCQSDSCAICLNDSCDQSPEVFSTCEHAYAFHASCLKEWVKIHKNCPLCRSPMNVVPPKKGKGRPAIVNIKLEAVKRYCRQYMKVWSRCKIMETDQHNRFFVPKSGIYYYVFNDDEMEEEGHFFATEVLGKQCWVIPRLQ